MDELVAHGLWGRSSGWDPHATGGIWTTSPALVLLAPSGAADFELVFRAAGTSGLWLLPESRRPHVVTAAHEIWDIEVLRAYFTDRGPVVFLAGDGMLVILVGDEP